MDWILGLALGKNGKASLLKMVGWATGIFGTIVANFPDLIPHSWEIQIAAILAIFGAQGAKNAIDKTAPLGTKANPVKFPDKKAPLGSAANPL